MLFLTTVTDWKGVGRGSHVIVKKTGTQYVFDINNVSNLKPEGTGCRFWYLVNTTNRKTGYEEIHCTTPYLTVHEEFDVGPISSALELSVFPDNNIVKPPFTTYINIYDFSYAWAHNPYPQYSWLVYCPKGSREKRILVDMTLIELVGMDNQFDENNTQWFYFVDPLELIHPTWYIRVEEIGLIKYGMLYNWYAAIDVRNIANTGWHVPTTAEIFVLQTYVGGQAVGGGYIKEVGLVYWDSPNTDASNDFGFNARGSGARGITGVFSYIKQYFNAWASDEFFGGHYNIFVKYDNAQFNTADNDVRIGQSIRLIKDSTILTHGQTGTYIGDNGRIYRTICIGTQEWLADNLAETKYRDGTIIPEIVNDIDWATLTTGAYCTFNNNWNNI